MPVINWNILRQAADDIEAANRAHAFNDDIKLRFDMSQWADKTSCGTVGCVAGFIAAHYEPEKYRRYADERMRGICFADKIAYADKPWNIAERLLGLDTLYNDDDCDTSYRLFQPGGYIDDIQYNKDLVPAMLRWMADNETIDLETAFFNVTGKTFEQDCEDRYNGE